MMRALLLVLATACVAPDDAAPPRVSATAQEMAVCAGDTTVYGIDVSRFQGDIDWQQVANSGVQFAYIQISRSLTDIDAKFPYNWRRAKEVGILRGAYQRFQPGQDVIGQAELFLEKLGPVQPDDLPPMLDVEDANGLTGAQIAAAVQQWIDHVEPRVGKRVVIYTGFYFWRDQVGGADFSAHPLWIANYSATCPLVPPAWTDWAIHQYSSTATIPGVTANTVDVNKFNGTLAELKALGTPAACGDAACTGDETADSCPADCAPCQLIEASTIVDDGGACFTAGGDPASIRHENAGFGSSLQWTYASDAAAPANYGQWALHFAEAGTYRVEAYTPAPFNGSTQTVYQVTHGDATTDVPVDQSAVDGWNLVGDFAFVAGGHAQAIRVDDNTGEPVSTSTRIVFDALRFTRIEPKTDEPIAGDPPAGGCATGGGGSGALALVVLAGFAATAGRGSRRSKA